MNINMITDIKNILTKREFEEFDKTFWEHPEETIKALSISHPEILFVHENIPSVCNLNGEDYETPSGVVAVVECDSVISTRCFKEGLTVLFPGKIEHIELINHPSGFCEIMLNVKIGRKVYFYATEYENGIPGGL